MTVYRRKTKKTHKKTPNKQKTTTTKENILPLQLGTKDNLSLKRSHSLLELDGGPEKAVDLNGDFFFGRYAYRLFLSLRIESHCQFIQTKLLLTFDNTHVGQSSTYN